MTNSFPKIANGALSTADIANAAITAVPETTELILTQAELAAFAKIAQNLAIKRELNRPARLKALALLKALDEDEARVEGHAQGALQMLLNLHGLEGEWHFDGATGKLVKNIAEQKGTMQ